MGGWPYTTRVDSRGVHRTGPWQPWRSTPVRAGVGLAWTAGAWWATGSLTMAVLAAGLAWWACRATR